MFRQHGLSRWGVSNSSDHSRTCTMHIGNQGVVKMLEQSRPESPKIETVTPFGVARSGMIQTDAHTPM